MFTSERGLSLGVDTAHALGRGAAMDYELRFLNARRARVFSHVVSCNTHKEAVGKILIVECPIVYKRIEIWLNGERVYEGPRIVVGK